MSLRAVAGARPTDAGFTLIETLAAMFLLTVGLLATAVVYDGSRGLTSVSERTAIMSHRAEAEIERVQALGWSSVAMSGAPTRPTDPSDPASMLTTDVPARLRPDRRNPSTVENLDLDTTAGQIPPGTRTWSDGRLHGRLAVWVSWRTDPSCGTAPTGGCPASQNAKRVTVVVTDDSGGHRRGPVVESVLLTDPNAAPSGLVIDGVRNPLRDPSITCSAPTGETTPCVTSVREGSGTTWFLYDTPASSDAWSPTDGDHPTHPTIAPTGVCAPNSLSGCPMPDLMGDEPTPSPDPAPPLLNRSSSEGASAESGGRVLRDDGVSCSGTPSADNARSERWVTPVQAGDATLTGDGGMTLYAQTTSGADAPVTVCAQLSVLDGTLAGLRTGTPTVLGTVGYTLDSWPGAMTPVSFTFHLPGTALTVPAGKRIGVRLWLAATSRSDLVIAYDHPARQSILQLNVR